jgi:hypothetical protein
MSYHRLRRLTMPDYWTKALAYSEEVEVSDDDDLDAVPPAPWNTPVLADEIRKLRTKPITGSLQAARREVFREIRTGAECPCCDQFVRLYKRKLNSNMVRFVRSLYVAAGAEYLHHTAAKYTSRDYPAAAMWGLIETDVENAGYWRVTPRGRLFLLEGMEVPSHAYVYNKELMGWPTTMVNAEKALGEHFKLSELMEAR